MESTGGGGERLFWGLQEHGRPFEEKKLNFFLLRMTLRGERITKDAFDASNF